MRTPASTLPLLLLCTAANAFTINQQYGRLATRLYDEGGWGMGPPIEIDDNARKGNKAERSADAMDYEMKDSAEFARFVQEEQAAIRKKELDEIREIADFAGIDYKKKKKPLTKFGDDILDIDPEYIDLRVTWDDEQVKPFQQKLDVPSRFDDMEDDELLDDEGEEMWSWGE